MIKSVTVTAIPRKEATARVGSSAMRTKTEPHPEQSLLCRLSISPTPLKGKKKGKNIAIVVKATATAIESREETPSKDTSTPPKNEEKRVGTRVRKVRFADPSTTQVYYKNNDLLSSSNQEEEEEDLTSLCWYSSEELNGFWQEMVETIREIFRQEKASFGPFFWSKALVQIYKAYHAPLAAQQSLFRLLQDRFEIPDEAVGLEMSIILTHMGSDIAANRKALWDKIQYWQLQEHNQVDPQDEKVPQDKESKEEEIAQACMEYSRVAMRYANFIATYHANRIASK